MKRLLAIVLGVLLFAAPVSASRFLVCPPPGVDSDGLALGSIDLDGNDLINMDDAYGECIATDAAPRVTVIGPQCVNTAPVLTNTTGANIVLAPTPGERVLEGVTAAGTAGDTLTITMYVNGVAQTPVVLTADTEWTCSTVADTVCVCNLYDYIVANPVVGMTLTRTDATCSDEKLSFGITPGAAHYLTVVTSDDVNVDMTAGVDGTILIGISGNANYPAIGSAEANDGTGTGLYWSSSGGRLNLTANGTLTFQAYSVSNTGFVPLDQRAHIFNAIGDLPFGAPCDSPGTTGNACFGGNATFDEAVQLDGAVNFDLGVITLGSADLKIEDDGGKGVATTVATHTESVVFTNDASQVTVGTLIPDGAWLVGLTTRVTTGDTGACTSMDIGDGADVDLWGDNQAITVNATTTNADATANWSNPQLNDQEVTITGVGGNCDALVVAITAHYLDATAATSN